MPCLACARSEDSWPIVQASTIDVLFAACTSRRMDDTWALLKETRAWDGEKADAFRTQRTDVKKKRACTSRLICSFQWFRWRTPVVGPVGPASGLASGCLRILSGFIIIFCRQIGAQGFFRCGAKGQGRGVCLHIRLCHGEDQVHECKDGPRSTMGGVYPRGNIEDARK